MYFIFYDIKYIFGPLNNTFAFKKDELLRAAAADLEASIAIRPSPNVACQYFYFASTVGSLGDYHSLMLARHVSFN